MRLTAFASLVLVIAQCRQAPRPSMITLASGKQVPLLSVEHTTKDGYVTLRVHYATDLPVADHLALQPEVEEVWSAFRERAVDLRADAVMISPHGKDRPAFTTFPITRMPNGSWSVPRVLALDSGTRVLLVDVSTQNGAWFVDYVTGLPTRTLCALAAEADGVWAALHESLDLAGIDRVFVVAFDAPFGTSVAFAFRPTEQGWSRTTARQCHAGA